MIIINPKKVEEASICGEILKLFKTLNNEKRLEVFLKLKNILWETKDEDICMRLLRGAADKIL